MRNAVAILLLIGMSVTGVAVPAAARDSDQASDALPYQYIYLADFSRLRHQAEKGNPEAQFQLGLLHYDPPTGSGIGQSYRRAFLLFFESALRGHSTAQHNVGAMYWNGDYVAQNVVEGYAWFQVAALAGDSAGQRKVKRHASELDARQLQAAKARLPQLQALLAKAKAEHKFEPRDYGIR